MVAKKATIPVVVQQAVHGELTTLPTAEQVHDVTATEAAAMVVPAAVKAPTFTWDDLPDADVQEYTRGIPRVDVLALTPEPIRIRVESSHTAYTESLRKFAASVDTDKVDPVKAKAALLDANRDATRVQLAGTPERAAEFLKLARNYAKYVGYTLRGAIDKRDSTKVVYYVKNKETRSKQAA